MRQNATSPGYVFFSAITVKDAPLFSGRQHEFGFYLYNSYKPGLTITEIKLLYCVGLMMRSVIIGCRQNIVLRLV
jgi:hypothetical protein